MDRAKPYLSGRVAAGDRVGIMKPTRKQRQRVDTGALGAELATTDHPISFLVGGRSPRGIDRAPPRTWVAEHAGWISP